MKKFLLTSTSVLLALTILSSCGAEPPIAKESSAASTEATTIFPVEATPEETKNSMNYEANSAYTQQIERYYTAICNQWDESAYFDQEMSAMIVYYYEENTLDNIGYAFMDLDGNNIRELIIGAIKNAELDPLVFEIWTLKHGEPTMLVQSGSHNRYYLQYSEEDSLWSISYEAENGAANHAVYNLQIADGNLEVIQGVVFDAIANENDPWFMTYDLDWDVSNDVPIDEDTANAVINAGRNTYTAIPYLPYSQYK